MHGIASGYGWRTIAFSGIPQLHILTMLGFVEHLRQSQDPWFEPEVQLNMFMCGFKCQQFVAQHVDFSLRGKKTLSTSVDIAHINQLKEIYVQIAA